MNDTDTYESFRPAYRTGYEGRAKYAGKTYGQAEPDLRRDYEKCRGANCPDWDRAKLATRDAWERVDETETDTDSHHTGCGCGD